MSTMTRTVAARGGRQTEGKHSPATAERQDHPDGRHSRGSSDGADSKSRNAKSSSDGSSSAAGRKKSRFHLEAPSARQVLLAGEFTDWEKSATPMQKDGDGVWTISLLLPPGRHRYKFLVDGEWCHDPGCPHYVPNTFGSFDSAIEVVLDS